MSSQVVAHTQEFGPYEFRFSRAEDFADIMKAIEAVDVDPSKKMAVYERDPDLVQWGAKHGLYAVQHRLIPNDDAPPKDWEQKLVGITGTYSLGLRKKRGFQDRFAIERPGGTQPLEYFVLDVGSTRYLKEWDQPNKNQIYPKNVFYVHLVGMTVLNAFHLAGKNLGERSHFIPDVITANVQTRKPLTPIRQRLIAPPLSFDLLNSSEQLERETGGTTTGDAFKNIEKDYFVYPHTTALPETAQWFLDAFNAGKILAVNGVTQQIVHIKFNVDPDFLETVRAIVRNKEWFAGLNQSAGLTDVRRQLSRVLAAAPEVESPPLTAANSNQGDNTRDNSAGPVNGTAPAPRRPLSASASAPSSTSARKPAPKNSEHPKVA